MNNTGKDAYDSTGSLKENSLDISQKMAVRMWAVDNALSLGLVMPDEIIKFAKSIDKYVIGGNE